MQLRFKFTRAYRKDAGRSRPLPFGKARIAAPLLGDIHRQVGRPQQCRGGVGKLRVTGDADTGTETVPAAADGHRLIQRLDEFLRYFTSGGSNPGRSIIADVLDQCHKLVPAYSRQGVAVPQQGTESRRYGLQCLIALGMAELVVDGFEFVQVDETDGEGALAVPGALDGALSPLHQQDPIRQAGEWVIVRHPARQLLTLAAERL